MRVAVINAPGFNYTIVLIHATLLEHALEMSHIVLITVAGPDHPGITAALTRKVADFSGTILDIGQAVIHDNLSLGFVSRLPADTDYAAFEAAISDVAQAQGLQPRVEKITSDEY